MKANKSFISKWFLALHAMLLMLICSANSYSTGIALDEHILTTDTIANQTAAIPDTAAGVGEVFYLVEEMPDFIYKDKHGIVAFRNYVFDNLRYPESEMETTVKGKVYVSFIVEIDGRISTIRIERGVVEAFDDEVMRVIAGSPKWIPGKQGGKLVRVTYTIPVSFDSL